MAKKSVKKKRVAKKGYQHLELTAFEEHLELLGWYRDGNPIERLSPLYAPGSYDPVGWWVQIGPFGREGLGCVEGPYWYVVEIVLPKQGLFWKAFSLLQERDDTSPTEFYLREIVWSQTRRTIRRMPAIDGPTAPWRRYDCDRMEREVRDGLKESPWLYFTFAGGDRPNIAFDSEFLNSFVRDVAKIRHTAAKDRKSFRRILRAIHMLDPDGVVEEIRVIVQDTPSIADAIRQMIPQAYHAATDDQGGLTLAQIARETLRSRSTITRRAKSLGCKPRVGKNGIHIYSTADTKRICDALDQP